MKRPYVVCHILSALDGKIAGSFFASESTQKVSQEYGQIRDAYLSKAWLYGTNTTKEFTSFQKPNLENVQEEIFEGDFIAETKLDFYYVSVDTKGEIGWESNVFKKTGREDAHVIEVLTESTSHAYRTYLRRLGISYILAGKDSLDCKLAVKKLYDLFHIDVLLICGGGVVNWSFVRQGVVDELSLLLAPVADGRKDTPTVFEQFDSTTKSKPIEFELKKVEPLKNDGVHLVYKTKTFE